MDTQITFFSSWGFNGIKTKKYWNGVTFTETPSIIKENLVQEMNKAWAWIEENAGILAEYPDDFKYTVEKAGA